MRRFYPRGLCFSAIPLLLCELEHVRHPGEIFEHEGKRYTKIPGIELINHVVASGHDIWNYASPVVLIYFSFFISGFHIFLWNLGSHTRPYVSVFLRLRGFRRLVNWWHYHVQSLV